jgi:hypothetical protein
MNRSEIESRATPLRASYGQHGVGGFAVQAGDRGVSNFMPYGTFKASSIRLQGTGGECTGCAANTYKPAAGSPQTQPYMPCPQP